MSGEMPATVKGGTIGNSIAAILANPTVPAPLRRAWQRFKCEFIKFEHVKSIFSRSVRRGQNPDQVRRSETPKQITIDRNGSAVEVIDNIVGHVEQKLHPDLRKSDTLFAESNGPFTEMLSHPELLSEGLPANESSESRTTSEPQRGKIAIEFLRKQSSRSNDEGDQLRRDKEQRKASAKISNTRDEQAQVQVPNFRNLNLASREEAIAAIHDLARFVTRQTVEPDAIKSAVRSFLRNEILVGDELESLLKHADAVKLEGESEFVREAVCEFIREENEAIEPTRFPAPVQDVATAESVKESSPAPETSGIVESTFGRIAVKDSLVFEHYVLDYFQSCVKRMNEGADDIPYWDEIDARLKALPRAEVVHIRDFFIRHAWISGFFLKGETEAEKAFGSICESFASNAGAIVSVLSADRQNRKADRFRTILEGYALDTGEPYTPSLMVQNYIDGLAHGDVGRSDVFEPVFEYFLEDENALVDELLEVRSQVDYLEILAGIADAARSSSPTPQDFRGVVELMVADAINEKVANVVRRYPAFGAANPLQRNERERVLERNNEEIHGLSPAGTRIKLKDVLTGRVPGPKFWAARRADEIDVVAEVLREAAGLKTEINRRQQRQLIPYRSKILARNSDVHQAISELRKEFTPADKSPGSEELASQIIADPGSALPDAPKITGEP